MSNVRFEDFEFRDEGGSVKFIFMKYYSFLVDKSDFKNIGLSKVNSGSLEFSASERAVDNKINRILEKGFTELVSILGNPTVFIHRGSGIPLLGTNEFGIVDRDTNIIEVKPHTLCNLDCIYCSVDAGRSSGKTTDFVVEKDYLVEEFKKISSMKKKPVEASINPQGEPLMYSRIFDLIRDLKTCEGVETVSINTNGALLTEEMVDRLVDAGLGRINLSLNTVNQDVANRLAGGFYPLENVMNIVRYCQGRIDVLIAPLIVPGYNDEAIDEFFKFCLSLKKVPLLGFQNFLEYKRGRNPVRAKSLDWFRDWLKKYQERYGVRLVHRAEDFNIFHDEKIPKPFKRNGFVKAVIACPGKYRGEFIAVANGRCITVNGGFRIGEAVKLKIVRDKHNIFRGTS